MIHFSWGRDRQQQQKVPIRLPLTVLGSLLLSTGLCAADPTLLEETDWNLDQGWNIYGPNIDPVDADNSDFSVERVGSGGNPGPHLDLVHTLATVPSGAVGSWVAMINENLAWDPADFAGGDGPSINFSMDTRRTDTSGQRIFTMAIRQDDGIWMATNERWFLSNDDWETSVQLNLGRLDFFRFPGSPESQPSRPDFSSTGSPITVGFATGLSCPSSSDCTRVVPKGSALDNLRVTVSNAADFQINPGLNDAWFNAATDGQGIFVNVYPDVNAVVIAWFTFDTDRPASDNAVVGETAHRWITAAGAYAGNRATLDVSVTRGMLFDSQSPAPERSEPGTIGTITLTFSDCANGQVDFDFSGQSGSFDIVRVNNDNIDYCEVLAAGP